MHAVSRHTRERNRRTERIAAGLLDRTFVERTKPSARHSEEQLEEDSFLSIGSDLGL